MSQQHFTPYTLTLDQVHLFDNNPSDDYQRLYFNYLLKNNVHVLDFSIKQNNYKSNIVHIFNNPPYLSNNSNNTNSNNNLCCFEYPLPDVHRVVHQDLHTHENSFDTTPFLLMGSIKVRHEHLNTHPPEPPTQKNITTTFEKITTHPLQSSSTPLTKNQQFKLTKLNYNSGSTSNLINPNNCVLWNQSTGFVFLTGIWRLYQDIMNGLSSMDRVSTTNLKNGGTGDGDDTGQQRVYVHSNDLKEKCGLELDHVLNYAFYEPILWDAKQARRRRSSLDSKKKYSQSSSSSDNNNNNTINVGDKTAEYTHYVDLHWNNLSKDLKQLILDDFRKFLDENYPENHITDLDLSLHIVQRIRGGYIKIQGTWLPWTVARLVCTRFCFPIRWLLVPLFGPQFPKDCEDYYFNIMLKNMKYIFEQNSSTLLKKDIDTHKKPSTRTRRNTYSGVSSMTRGTATTTAPMKARQRKKRHSTTNIPLRPPPPPAIGSTKEEVSPRTKKIDLKISNNNNTTDFSPKFIPKVSRRRSKSDFGINPYMNFNPLLSSTILSTSSPSSSPTSASTSSIKAIPSSLPPIKSVFEQINPYDVPFLASPNTLFNTKNNFNNKSENNSNQPFVTRPRINSLPCPSITNPSKYYTNNYIYNVGNPSSGVSALSNLSMFYNTRGQRYSYPKAVMQPRVISGNDENFDSTTKTPATCNANNDGTIGTSNTSKVLSYGVSTSETFYTDNNGADYNSNL